ncbi:MAG: hypothetical protein ACRBG0_03615 [Lewinella sp.]|uniref:hypothetical protein n=1 Tax=Lewinella sp. TaxID=2004506 RepID=UPI003D6C3EF2
MRNFLSLCFCLSLFTTFAQNAEIRLTTGLMGSDLFTKISVARFYENNTLTNYYALRQDFRVSPYIGIEKRSANGVRQSWGILRASFNNSTADVVRSDSSTGIFEPTSGEKRREISLALRWALSKRVTAFSGQRFTTSLGFAVDPFFLYYRSVPSTSAGFPFTLTQLGVTGSFLTQFEYRITSRLGVVLQAPITFSRLYGQKASLENPLLTTQQQSNSLIDGEVKVRTDQFLLGVSYKL